MILAVSRFRVANGLEEEVKAAFRQRPRLVDGEPGFLGMETFTDAAEPTTFYLVTRWTDATAFEAWHRSDAHHLSHRFIPRGLKLDSEWTKLLMLDRIESREGPAVFEAAVADSTLPLSRFLADTDAVYFLVASPAGTIELVNRALADRLGRDAVALAGTPIWDHLGDHDRTTLRAALARGRRASADRVLLNFYDAQGAPFTVDAQVDPQPIGFTLLAAPTVSRDRRVEEELFTLNNEWAVIARERAQTAARAPAARGEAELRGRAKDELLAAVSHDLRTPLNAVVHAVYTLRRLVPAAPDATRLLDIVERSATLQQRLIEDLVDLSRVNAGTLELRLAPVSLGHVIDATLAALRHEADRKRIVLDASTEDGVEVLGDAERLRQVANNIVGNAIKFTPEDGRVVVRVDRSAHQGRFIVTDSGPGIPVDLLPHIFQPFRQGPGGERRAGLGLGLAIAKHIVDLHGGTVQAESRRAGTGATFTVSLPLAAER
ncbi:MAG TPA: ATP-binding protein [Methylomirabilota bacterium]|nr:ATP-binding protein [Methylomirabilota bacterium]